MYSNAKRMRRPFHEAIALGISLHLTHHVAPGRIADAEQVDGNGVVCRDVDWKQRAQTSWIAASLRNDRAHGRYVHERGSACRVVHEDATRHERNLHRARSRFEPPEESEPRVLGVWSPAANRVFEQDAMENRHVPQPTFGRAVQVDDARTYVA
jgi:hypothetical protein